MSKIKYILNWPKLTLGISFILQLGTNNTVTVPEWITGFHDPSLYDSFMNQEFRQHAIYTVCVPCINPSCLGQQLNQFHKPFWWTGKIRCTIRKYRRRIPIYDP